MLERKRPKCSQWFSQGCEITSDFSYTLKIFSFPKVYKNEHVLYLFQKTARNGATLEPEKGNLECKVLITRELPDQYISLKIEFCRYCNGT